MLAVGVGGGVGGRTLEEKKASTHSPVHRLKSLASNIDIFLGQAITACFVGDATFDFQAFYSVSGAWAHVDPFW